MTISFLLFIIFMIKFCIKDHKKINIFILIIINEYFPNFIYSNNIIDQKQSSDNKKNINDNKKEIKEIKNNENIIQFNIRNNGKKEKEKKIISALLKKSKFRRNKVEPKNGYDSLNRLKNNSLNFNKNINIKSENNDINEKKNEILNDQELNSLEYKLAIQYDKRNYFEYYWSLLKKKHLIFFSFIPTNDYNIISIKICLFFISFSLSFTINGFFFTDETMHNIYINNGTIIHFINQIPKILYSSIISILIQQILKFLCLSENNILKIKKEKKYH